MLRMPARQFLRVVADDIEVVAAMNRLLLRQFHIASPELLAVSSRRSIRQTDYSSITDEDLR